MKRSRHKYPITLSLGEVEVWHYGDGKLYVYPVSNQCGASNGTGVILPRGVVSLLLLLKGMIKPKRKQPVGKPAPRKRAKKGARP